jgi:hypothetical protein
MKKIGNISLTNIRLRVYDEFMSFLILERYFYRLKVLPLPPGRCEEFVNLLIFSVLGILHLALVFMQTVVHTQETLKISD